MIYCLPDRVVCVQEEGEQMMTVRIWSKKGAHLCYSSDSSGLFLIQALTLKMSKLLAQYQFLSISNYQKDARHMKSKLSHFILKN